MDTQDDMDALETLLAQRGVTAETMDLSPQETLLPEHLQNAKTLGTLIHELPKLLASKEDGSELQVMDTLGQGGMGVVFLARQWTLGREVAVKMLRPEVRSEVVARRSMLQEAWITGRLEHPNVIPVHALGVDDEMTPLLVMKRVVGVSWRDALDDPDKLPARYHDMPRNSAHLEILGQICDAVHFAHARGILHRDLKPDNVMLGEFGEVYLVDWGIAVALEDDESGRVPLARDVDAPAGTPAYMAPEMALGEGDRLTSRTDVYLLGAILHELMTGGALHQGESIMAVLMNAVRSRPATYGPHVPEELADLCRRATHADPAQRPESAEAFRRELDAFERHATARQLVAEAQEQLISLRTWSYDEAAGLEASERVGVYRAFGACRFGFEQALAQWPSFEVARVGEREALALMFMLELDWGNLDAAEALLTELDPIPEGAEQRLDELRVEKDQQRERLVQLERMERDLDIEVGGRRRAVIAALLALVWFSGPVMLGRSYRTLPADVFEVQNLTGRIAVAFLVFVLLMVAKRFISNTLVNMYVILIAALIMFTSIMSAFFDIMLPITSTQSLQIEFFMYTMFSLGFSGLIDRRLFPTGLIFGSFLPLSQLVPEPYHFELTSVVNLLGTGYISWVWGTGGGVTGLLERLNLTGAPWER